MINRSYFAALASTAVISMVATAPAMAQAQVSLDLPAQELSKSLRDVARATNTNIIFDPAQTRGKKAPPLKGQYTAEGAINQLLVNQSLAARSTGTGTWVVSAEGNAASAAGAVTDRDSAERLENDSADDQEEAIVVTGSYIPQANGGASPVQSYNREEVERRGYSTVGEFFQTIPQNSGAGVNESNANGLAAPNGNFAIGGTGVNLRGLGNTSTLTLLNGQRLAPSGRQQYVDVSAIPASAIKRIEILTDGASAIYGSDAVAGVVNIILRDDFKGFETRLRHVNGDGFHENEVSQTAGLGWKSGHIMATYDFRKHSGLDANDRSFTRDAADPLLLLPKIKAHTLLVAGRQDLSPSFRLRAQGFYNKRHFDQFTNLGLGGPINNSHTVGSVEQYLASANAEFDLPGTWLGNVIGTTSRSRADTLVTNAAGTAPRSEKATTEDYELQTIFRGPLIHLPAGDVRAAVGGQYERTSYRERTFQLADAHRDRWSAFLELLVPIVSAEQNVPAINELTLNVAGRYDHYSDFGSSTNPKLGLVWRPVENAKIRASYGTSFHAPNFDQLNETVNQVTAARIPNPTPPGGTTATLLLGGRNADLRPETATTWSAGFDFRIFRGLTVSATYWDINYKNRISLPTSGVPGGLQGILRNENLIGDLLIRNPSLALIQETIASVPQFLNPQNIPLNQIGAIFDGRVQNLSTDRMHGIDIQASSNFNLGRAKIFSNLTGQYILDLKRKILATSPSVSLVDTIFNPADLRLRFDAGLQLGGFSFGGAVNYTDDYFDKRPVPNVPSSKIRIDSWTTVDLNASYRTNDAGPRWLRGIVISANVVNLFDKDPPFLQRGSIAVIPLHYDGANANPLGRFASFQITKTW